MIWNAGDTVTFAELASAELPPPGTVLLPDDGSQPRVIADYRQAFTDTHIFTDKTGFVGVKEFTVLHVPTVKTVDPVDGLALELVQAGNPALAVISSVDDARVHHPDRWRARATWVLENFDRKGTPDGPPVEIVDGAGDRWFRNDKGTYDSEWGSALFSDYTEAEIEQLDGIEKRVYA